METNQKGKFIAIDGTDGSGKGTQAQILKDRFIKEGYDVEMADFPQYGQESAVLVKKYLNGNFGTAKDVGPYRASIFYACDRYSASFKIRSWLNEGKVVISNRYTSANMGHQAGQIKDLGERDKFLDWLEDLEFNIFGIPKPELNILLYLDPKIGQELVDQKGHRDYVGGEKKDILEADLNHLMDAAEAFKYVADKYSWTTIDCADDGNQIMSREKIHDLIWDSINKNFNNNNS